MSEPSDTLRLQYVVGGELMTGRGHIAVGVGTTVVLLGLPQNAMGGLDAAILVPAAIAAAAGSLAPDLDHPSSLASLSIPASLITYAGVFLAVRSYEITHPTAFSFGLSQLGPGWVAAAWISLMAGFGLLILSFALGAMFGHRGPVHSVFFGLCASVLVLLALAIVNAPLWLAGWFAWGWWAHLAADAMTPAGLSHVLWPITERPGARSN